VLPLRVADGTSERSLPPDLAERQIIEYRSGDRTELLRLLQALAKTAAAPALPDPLPVAPEVPVSYLGRLGQLVDSVEELSEEKQNSLLVGLSRALRESETQREARDMLAQLRRRRDLRAPIADEIDRLMVRPNGSSAQRVGLSVLLVGGLLVGGVLFVPMVREAFSKPIPETPFKPAPPQVPDLPSTSDKPEHPEPPSKPDSPREGSLPTPSSSQLKPDPVKAAGMVKIPAGSFTRGKPVDKDEGHAGDLVVITRDFLLGRTDVTQEEYARLMGTNPSWFRGADRRPVENVSWLDAVKFCNARSRAEGLDEAYEISGEHVTWKQSSHGYRLPTEAEWEYAARAGTNGERYGQLDAIAWYGVNSNKQTHPAGQKQPNAWGLYDMLGNVWEWCWDWYGDYPAGGGRDLTGSMGGSARVYRGGSWLSPALYVRASCRLSWTPGARGVNLGFRLARSLP